MVFRYDGPDISSFQPTARWAEVAATGARFAGIRLGHGPYSIWSVEANAVIVRPGFIDPHAVGNLVDARAAGMPYRALYYVISGLESPEEAVNRVAAFFASVGLQRPGDLLALDYEGNPNRGPDGELVAPAEELPTPAQVEVIRQQMAQAFGASKVGIYGSRGYLDDLDLPSFGWRWLASYTLDVRAKATEWGCEVFQWTSSATIPGVDAGRVDMNEVLDPDALSAAGGFQEVAPVGSPKGSLDLVEDLGGGRVRVAGWAYDEDVPDQSIETHVYLNGILAGVAPADGQRDDVNAALGITGAHGFDATFEVAVPTRIDVYGINVGDGSNAHVGGKVDFPVGLAPAVVPAPEPEPAAPFDPETVRSLVRAEIAATPFETKAVPTGA